MRTTLALVAAIAISGHVFAQPRPGGQIIMIIPFSSGSPTESSVRLVAAEASKHLGQTIVPENRSGGGGRIAVDALLGARNDGSTIAVANSGMTVVLPITTPSLSLQPERDYAPVVLTSTSYGVIAVNPSVKFRDVKGMLDFARANPGKLNVTGVTLGSSGHIGFALLTQKYGFDVTSAFYKQITQAQTDAVNGTVDVIWLAASAKPLIDAGRLIAIATTAPQRWSLFPDTPTFLESGIPELNFGAWYGIIAPAGTPAAVVAALNKSFNAAVNLPDVKAKHTQIGMTALGSTSAEFAQHIRAEQQRWGPVIRKLDLKVD